MAARGRSRPDAARSSPAEDGVPDFNTESLQFLKNSVSMGRAGFILTYNLRNGSQI